MKNRFLQFTFLVFLTGFASAVMASLSDGGQNTSSTKKMSSGEYLHKIRSNQNTGIISVSDVINARKASQELFASKGIESTYEWSALGPINMAGSTKAVLFDNRDASGNTLFVGSTSGGLFKTINYGATWEKVAMDNILNVATICQTSNGTIYAGTGVSLEPATENLSEGSTIGKGIFQSTSGGSFELMAGTEPTGTDGNGEWAFIQKLAVDAGNHLFAATNTGLKYFDGSSWSLAKAGAESLVGKSCDVVTDGDILITAVAGKAYVSTTGVNGFVLVSGIEEGMLPEGIFGNIKFAISPSNNNYIYASYITATGALYNVYVSTDKGNSWRVVYPGGSSLGDIFNGQGLRNNAIAVDPANEKTVLLGAYDMFRGYEAQPTGYYSWSQITNGNDNPYPEMGTTQYVHFGVNGIYFNPANSNHVIIATDGGLSITKDGFSSTQLLNRGYVSSEYFTINSSKSGVVIGGVHFNGVHLIYDNGAKQAIDLLGSFGTPSPETGGFSYISFINPEFYVVSSAEGSFFRSEDEGENYNADILSGITLGAEFITPLLIWETTNDPYPGDSAAFIANADYTTGDEVWVTSNNYDYPFKATLTAPVANGETALIPDVVTTKSFLAVQGNDAVAGFEGGVYMTTGMLDYTASPAWWQIGAVEGIPTCMALSKDANYLWVGTLEGKLFRLSNIARANSQAKASITSPGCIIAKTEIANISGQAITSISVDQKNSNNVVYTLGNYGNNDYVFVSTNAMNDSPAFNSIQGNLPKMPVYASSFEVNNDGLIFLGTENGLFFTDNFNAQNVSWTFENSEFGNVPVFAIKQQSNNWPYTAMPVGETYLIYPAANNYGSLYIGTFGSGVYVTRDFVGFDEFEENLVSANSIAIYPNPASRSAQVAFRSNRSNQGTLNVYDLSGKLVHQQNIEVKTGLNTINIEMNDLDNGSYIVRLQDGEKSYQSKLVISK